MSNQHYFCYIVRNFQIVMCALQSNVLSHFYGIVNSFVIILSVYCVLPV